MSYERAGLPFKATCVTLAQYMSQVERDTFDEWAYSKSREMLFYLICNPARTKEQIGLARWPDASSAQLYDNFRIILHFLRNALGRPEWVVFEGGLYAFNCSMRYWFDVEAFEFDLSLAQLALEKAEPQAALAADYLDRATSLYDGDFLDGAEAEWCSLLREDLLRKVLQALVARGGLFFEAGDYVRATEVYSRTIAKDGYLEAAHRGLMRCLARQGELKPGAAPLSLPGRAADRGAR